MNSRLMATVAIASFALLATPMLNRPAYAQPATNSGGSALYPVLIGAAVGGVVTMLIWPVVAPVGAGVMMAAPMGAGAMAGPEMAAGMAGAGPMGWRAIIATRTLVGAGVGAVAGYLFSR